MPTMNGRTILTAGASATNVLQGLQYEMAPYDCTIEVGVMATAVGVTMSLASGPDILAQAGSPVPFNTTEQLPKYPDEYHWEDEAAAGDRIALGLVNPTAGSITVNWVVRVTPR